MIKIVFLDPSAALLARENESCGDERVELDSRCVRRLNRITSFTGAKIVLIGDWRRGTEETFRLNKRYLYRCGLLADIVDRTPVNVRYRQSCDDIDEWLNNSGLVEHFVILSDCVDMGMYTDHLVSTEFEEGLIDDDVETAIKILERENDSGD